MRTVLWIPNGRWLTGSYEDYRIALSLDPTNSQLQTDCETLKEVVMQCIREWTLSPLCTLYVCMYGVRACIHACVRPRVCTGTRTHCLSRGMQHYALAADWSEHAGAEAAQASAAASAIGPQLESGAHCVSAGGPA